MAWLLVPTAIHLTDERDSFGYLRGIETEDGYFAFETYELGGEDDEPKVVVSDSFMWQYAIGGVTHFLRGFRYNGAPVWSNEDGTSYVFTSATQGKRIMMGALREPYLRALIDGETETDLVGDGWWEVPDMPKLRKGYACVAKGTAIEDCGGEGNKTGARVWNVWEPAEAQGQGENDDWCGVYRNNDPDWTGAKYKSIGVPVFKFFKGPGDWSGERYFRSIVPEEEKVVYKGDKGHDIRWNAARECYVAGSVAPGSVWFESEDPPVVPIDGYSGGNISWWGTSFTFSPKWFDPDTGEVATPDGVGDLGIRFEYYALGLDREEIFVGEVEEWR